MSEAAIGGEVSKARGGTSVAIEPRPPLSGGGSVVDEQDRLHGVAVRVSQVEGEEERVERIGRSRRQHCQRQARLNRVAAWVRRRLDRAAVAAVRPGKRQLGLLSGRRLAAGVDLLHAGCRQQEPAGEEAPQRISPSRLRVTHSRHAPSAPNTLGACRESHHDTSRMCTSSRSETNWNPSGGNSASGKARPSSTWSCRETTEAVCGASTVSSVTSTATRRASGASTSQPVSDASASLDGVAGPDRREAGPSRTRGGSALHSPSWPSRWNPCGARCGTTGWAASRLGGDQRGEQPTGDVTHLSSAGSNGGHVGDATRIPASGWTDLRCPGMLR